MWKCGQKLGHTKRGASSRAMHNWMWIFSLFLAPQRYSKEILKKFKREYFFTPESLKKLVSKVAYNRHQFFLAPNQPIFLTLKNGCLHDFYIRTLYTTPHFLIYLNGPTRDCGFSCSLLAEFQTLNVTFPNQR